MAKTQPTIVLSKAHDIPFNKLVLSQANVRRVKTGLSIEELAEDIARRGLLQSLSVRPVRDAGGADTGAYEVPAGGRRFRALELLVKQKRMAKTQPVPCVVREDGIAEEDSLAENVQRVALHPLDQFRAFRTLRDAGLGEEDIAARFFVGVNVVRQRLKLVTVSPKLLDLYADDEMTLEQLMAFTVTDDQARQEQVWEGLAHSYNKEPYYIRRQLTESTVCASDKRARFVGVAAYEAAGGIVMRDLFEEDDGGWLRDGALLDRLAIAKLTSEAEALRPEGWRWIEVAVEFPYGHAAGLRRLPGTVAEVSAEAQARHEALCEEFDRLNDEYADADDIPEEVARRLDELEAELQAFAERPEIYDPAEIARAGAFVSISNDGGLRIERGYVRREDEVSAEGEGVGAGRAGWFADGSAARPVIITVVGDAGSPDAEAGDEDDGIKPLSERLVTELTAHRTLALRNALAGDPEIAFVAALHAFCLKAFCHSAVNSFRFQVHQAESGMQPPTINCSVSALRFFFTVTLDRPDLSRRLVLVRHPRKLPTVLSVEEVGGRRCGSSGSPT